MKLEDIKKYMEAIRDGQVDTAIHKMIYLLMNVPVASIGMLMQITKIDHPYSITSKLKTLQCVGCVRKIDLGYQWINDPEKWPAFAKIYKKQIAIKRVEKAILDNANDYHKGYAIRSMLEVEEMQKEIAKEEELLLEN